MTGRLLWADKPKPLCACGSGKRRRDQIDARGIFLTFACDSCWPRKRQQYAPGVLTDPNYPVSEPVEEC